MDKIKAAEKFIKLLEIVEKLRGADGCPWDREQTNETLIPYLLEETYEVIESIDSKDWATLNEELGDVLLHIVLQSQIAREDKKFNIIDSIDNINQKLIRRHPHVFGDNQAKTPFESKQNWESIKHVEKNRKSRLDGVPESLPALARAYRLAQKASYAGFDFKNIDDVWKKFYEEIDELKEAFKLKNHDNIKEEIGDVLFSLVNLSRFLDLSAEDILRKTNKKFINRFQFIEKELASNGGKIEESNLQEMEEIWGKSKKEVK